MLLQLVLCALNIVNTTRVGHAYEYVESLLCLIPRFPPLIIRIMYDGYLYTYDTSFRCHSSFTVQRVL